MLCMINCSKFKQKKKCLFKRPYSNFLKLKFCILLATMNRIKILKKIILLHDIQVKDKGQQAVSQTSLSVYNDQAFKRSMYMVSINSYSKISK